jgi:radical SAM protein with 4Fe4S-binding SPASM domain
LNISTFTESHHFHPGLNRKIAVDAAGNIRHFPGHSQQFGQLGSQSLAEVVANPAFRQIWHITKDQVAGCKACEFRYVCPDNTELTFEAGSYQRVYSCAYDPYTARWLAQPEQAISSAAH